MIKKSHRVGFKGFIVSWPTEFYMTLVVFDDTPSDAFDPPPPPSFPSPNIPQEAGSSLTTDARTSIDSDQPRGSTSDAPRRRPREDGSAALAMRYVSKGRGTCDTKDPPRKRGSGVATVGQLLYHQRMIE
jgi:hypothetical protein